MSSALLLTEAEATTRSFLARHLTQDGFEVVGAENGNAFGLAHSDSCLAACTSSIGRASASVQAAMASVPIAARSAGALRRRCAVIARPRA